MSRPVVVVIVVDGGCCGNMLEGALFQALVLRQEGVAGGAAPAVHEGFAGIATHVRPGDHLNRGILLENVLGPIKTT